VTANAAERGNSEASSTPASRRRAADCLQQPLPRGRARCAQARTVTLGLNGANQAGVVRPSGGDHYSHVIMPMVIGGQ